VWSAAKRHRDALPDRDDVVHLFGEPFPAYAEAVAWLAELKTGGDASFIDELRGWSTVDQAQQALARLTGDAPPGERIGATLRLGKLPREALDDPDHAAATARSLASAYVGQGADLAIPYFDLG
jgi:hypothetical protein